MAAMDVIVASTSGVAKAYGKTEFGSIVAGKYADLVVLDADPLVNIDNLGAITDVYKGGARVDREALPTQPMATEAEPVD